MDVPNWILIANSTYVVICMYMVWYGIVYFTSITPHLLLSRVLKNWNANHFYLIFFFFVCNTNTKSYWNSLSVWCLALVEYNSYIYMMGVFVVHIYMYIVDYFNMQCTWRWEPISEQLFYQKNSLFLDFGFFLLFFLLFGIDLLNVK